MSLQRPDEAQHVGRRRVDAAAPWHASLVEAPLAGGDDGDGELVFAERPTRGGESGKPLPGGKAGAGETEWHDDPLFQQRSIIPTRHRLENRDHQLVAEVTVGVLGSGLVAQLDLVPFVGAAWETRRVREQMVQRDPFGKIPGHLGQVIRDGRTEVQRTGVDLLQREHRGERFCVGADQERRVDGQVVAAVDLGLAVGLVEDDLLAVGDQHHTVERAADPVVGAALVVLLVERVQRGRRPLPPNGEQRDRQDHRQSDRNEKQLTHRGQVLNLASMEESWADNGRDCKIQDLTPVRIPGERMSG